MHDNLIHAAFSRAWWALALRGGLAILFGIAAFIWPGLTIALFVGLFAGFALLDGVLSLAGGIQAHMWHLTVFGIVGIVAGIGAVMWPGVTALTLLFFIATWAILRGVAEISTAVMLRRVIPNEWLLVAGGLASIAFGVFAFASPGAGALALIWLIASYSIAIGLVLLMVAFRVRGVVRPLAPNPVGS